MAHGDIVLWQKTARNLKHILLLVDFELRKSAQCHRVLQHSWASVCKGVSAHSLLESVSMALSAPTGTQQAP